MTTELANRPISASREIEIDATPEQVWQAIATGQGQAGWQFPAEIEPRVGGTIVMHRQPFGGDATGRITAFEPPHRFSWEEEVGAGSPWAAEITVEGRGGHTVVRVVTGFYEGGEGWEPMVEGAAEGWLGALQYLRIYAPNFLGQAVTGFGVTGDTGKPLSERTELSKQLLGALAVHGLKPGDAYRAPAGAPALAGTVGGTPDDGPLTDESHGLILHTEEPGPGMFEISTFSMDGQTVTVNAVGRLFGDGTREAADRAEADWVGWLKQHFPDVEPVTIPR
jgi:uncharacterized protein YndB with AHSA1/START domain